MTRALITHVRATNAALLPALHAARIDPVLCVVNTPPLDAIRPFAPGARLLDNLELQLGRWPDDIDAVAAPPFDLLDALAPTERRAFEMLNRYRAGRSIQELKTIYNQLVGRCQALLKSVNADVVVFLSAPHVGYDYVLYTVARHLGIPTRVVRVTDLPGRALLSDSVDTLPGPTLDAVDRYLAEHPELPDAWAERPKLDPARTRANQKAAWLAGGRKPRNLRERARWVVERNPVLAAARSLLAGDRTNPLQPPTRVAWERYVSRRALQRYQRIAIDVPLDVPYVYFPLSMQPEMTTLPLGGLLDDQIGIVRALSATSPPDWRIYVREHPIQFVQVQFTRGRFATYYDELLSIPKVSLVPLSVSSLDLTERARVTATITGTVGWEALQRGKSPIVFGSPWYLHAPCVISVRSADDLRAVFSRITNGDTPPSSRRLAAWTALMAQPPLSFHGPSRYADVSEDQRRDAAESFAGALKRSLN